MSWKHSASNAQSGAVAVFTAIFFLLLVSVITIGFLRMMLQEQGQAIDNDLSQSALNSAQSGVEDAKRVVNWYRENCIAGTSSACSQVATALNGSSCNTIYGNPAVQGNVGGFTLVGGNGGVQVSKDSSFNQAYTCMTVTMNTPNLPGTAKEGKSEMIPLKAVGNFNKIKLRWYSTRDTGGSNPSLTTASAALLDKPSWPALRPPVMRVQLIQHPNGNFKLSDVRQQTLFEYPNRAVTTTADYFSSDVGGENTVLNPTLASCGPTGTRSSIYYCEADFRLDPSLGTFDVEDTSYYLRLTSIYKDSDYQLELFNGLTAVDFNGVQPIVDVTGRANDVFRRVQVGLRADVADMPENVLETAQQLCKNFRVTSEEADFNGASCAPAP